MGSYDPTSFGAHRSASKHFEGCTRYSKRLEALGTWPGISPVGNLDNDRIVGLTSIFGLPFNTNKPRSSTMLPKLFPILLLWPGYRLHFPPDPDKKNRLKKECFVR